MAFVQCDFYSETLRKSTKMNVIIPENIPAEDEKFLYLLHGLSDDESKWSRYTSIERYAAEYNFFVIMPDGSRSFYTDAENGANYWSFISGELPQKIKTLFNRDCPRERTFAAGLSMGGYGALKLGLRCPEMFAATAGLSSVTDLKSRFNSADSASWLPELRRIFGSPELLAERKNDLFSLAEAAVNSGKTLPKILSICGTDDFMLEDNRRFNAHMHRISYPEYFCFERPGSHTWSFWDKHIQDVLEFFANGNLPK